MPKPRQTQDAPIAARDIADAIARLKSPNAQTQRRAGGLLIAAGADALPSLVAALRSGDATTRRGASFVLGQIIRQVADPAAVTALTDALADPEPKVRKNAAIALGKLGDSATVAALLAQAQAETIDYVRPSLILALGQIGGAAAHAALDQMVARTDDDDRALRLALERSSPQQLTPIDLAAPVDGTLDLLCRFGVEPIVIDEVRAANIRFDRTGPSFVRLLWRGTLADLFGLRCFHSFALPVTQLPSDPVAAPRALAASVARSAAVEIARRLTQRGASDPIPYRITFDLPPRANVRHREWIAAWTAAFDPLAPDFRNSPSRYSWELLLRYDRRQWYVGLRPTAFTDPRFSYRVADVPAALNPSVAAAMARLLPVAASDVVLDPFCGSGTPLIERARRGPFARLIGTDRDPQALDAARTNVATAGLADQIDLAISDVRDLRAVLDRRSIAQVDAIITNPPYGVRSESQGAVARLYPSFMRAAAEVLRPGGSIVMLAKELALVIDAAQEFGFTIERDLRVDAGGILIYLLALRRA